MRNDWQDYAEELEQHIKKQDAYIARQAKVIEAYRQRFEVLLGVPRYAAIVEHDRRAKAARKLYQEGWSLRKIQHTLWGYCGGAAYHGVKNAITSP